MMCMVNSFDYGKLNFHAPFSVALTNLEDEDNAKHAYEQAVALEL